jgi:hypothetical protein
MQRKISYQMLGTALLLFIQGYLVGRIVDVRISPSRSIDIVVDDRMPVPTVQIDGIRNGYLGGELIGEVRFFLADTQVFAGSGGVFHVLADDFLRNEVRVIVPAGMQYVASRNGKKYYPVFSAAGERIVPKNRVYFRTAAEAQRAGYVP